MLGYTNEPNGAYTDHPVIIFDDFTTASKYVDFDFKAKSSAMKMLTARAGAADLRFVYERMQLIRYPIFDHKRRWIAEFSKLEIEAPELVEQTAIAEVANDLTDHIAALERLIAKKQAIKQGMMQQLLTGRTRLPGFSEPWTETRLGTLGRCIRGVGYDPDTDLFSGDRPFTARLLRSNNVQNGRIDRSGLQFVHERRVSDAQLLKSGDIVICMANGSRALVGKAAMFEESNGGPRYTFGAFMGAFRTYSSVAVPRFVAEMMGTHAFRNWLDIILSGSSINNLRPGDVEGFAAQMPGRAEQLAIAEVLANAAAEIDILRNRLTKARAIKAGMMQQLLTGRTRLPVEVAS